MGPNPVWAATPTGHYLPSELLDHRAVVETGGVPERGGVGGGGEGEGGGGREEKEGEGGRDI